MYKSLGALCGGCLEVRSDPDVSELFRRVKEELVDHRDTGSHIQKLSWGPLVDRCNPQHSDRADVHPHSTSIGFYFRAFAWHCHGTCRVCRSFCLHVFVLYRCKLLWDGLRSNTSFHSFCVRACVLISKKDIYILKKQDYLCSHTTAGRQQPVWK